MSGTWTPGPGATTGADTFVGGTGNDTASALAGNDSLLGGTGNDSLLGGEDNDTILGGTGSDFMDGGAGTGDIVSYQDATSGVGITIQGATNVTTGGSAAGDTILNFEGFIGSEFNDTIISPNGGFGLYGGGGNDYLLAGQNQDTVIGGSGVDTIFGGNQGDSLTGGFFNLETAAFGDDSQTDYVVAGEGNDTAWAGQGDILAGQQGAGDFAYVPIGYTDSGNDSIIATPTDRGGTSNLTYDIWTSTVPGAQPIYLSGFEGTGTYTPVPCFATGTLVATARGEVAVENLLVGDLVVTAHGGAPLQPVIWLGHSRVDVARQRNRAAAAPILIKAGALADGVPHRDLRVSPEHAMFLDGRLVPAKHLVNGTTIVQELWCPEVTYWHVELPAHGLLVAEGAVSESYFDDGSRKHFDNYGITTLFKDFASERHNGRYAEAACYPLLQDGPALERIRARLDARAAKVEAKAMAAQRSA